MLSGILAVGSVFPAFAQTITFNAPGSTTEGTSTEQTTETTSATAETSGTIHAGSTQVETGGPGMPTQSASTTEATPDGVTTNAPGGTTDTSTTTDSTSTETSASSEVSSDGNALTDAQGAELEAERAAAEAEAQEDSNNPLKVPQREPHLQTTVLLIADGMTWSNPYVNDQQIEGASAGFSSISTFLENIHGDLLYRTYNSQTGWTGWAMNGQQTAGAANPIPVEAIQYRFAGIVGDQFDIYYSTILSDGTQTGWAKNGESAGSMNKGLFITGYRLAFFRKGTNGAEALDTTNALVSDHADGIQIVDGAMRYIHGDGSNQQLLLEEGIARAEAFAALTGFDEENIMLSLYAATVTKAKLVTKINRIAFEDVIQQLNLGSIIYPKMITADTITQYVRAMQNSMGSNIETLYKIVAGKAEALEFRVGKDAPMIGIPLEKLNFKNNLLIACINRNGQIITPRGKDTIEVGDTVIVVTTHSGLNDLKDILR